MEVGNQGNQAPELPQPENIGATQQEPTREEPNQGDQPPKLPIPVKDPMPEEPKVLASSQDPQVKGLEAQTEEYDRECEACNHFFSSNMYRHSHVTRYHKALLR